MEFLSLTEAPLIHAFHASSLTKRGEYHYKMEDKWALHCYFGSGDLTIGDESHVIEPGLMSITPAGLPSFYHVDRDFSYLYSHFSPQKREPSHGIPRFIIPGKDLVDLIRKGRDSYPHDPCMGRAILWHILLALGETQRGEVVENKQSIINKAKYAIGNNLFTPFSLSQFSRDLGISSTHLNRLFKKEWGTTVYQYVMKERMERIEYFISQTDISIKQIALEAGYDDLQQFNKHCRRYLGNSPRELRSKG